MRLTTIAAALVVAGCAGTQTADTAQAAKRACGGTSCFYEREVRDFEVINHTTLIVYVGAQRCPYQVELIGTFCDMEFATELYFNSRSDPGVSKDPANDAILAGVNANSPQYDARSSTSQLKDLHICANDISVGVSGGSFTTDPANAPVAGVRGARSDCQIQSVASLTDDKLIELYVRRGVVAPPPPMGSGQIQVGAQSTPPPGGGAGGAGGPAAAQGNSPESAEPASRLNGVDRN
jgi:hypothetical protein